MKKEDFNKLKQLNPKDLSCTFEEACNNFLKTRKGLSYLIIRFPKLSLQDAIREYKNREAEISFI